MAMLRYAVERLEEAKAELVEDELETDTDEVTVVWHGPPGQTHL